MPLYHLRYSTRGTELLQCEGALVVCGVVVRWCSGEVVRWCRGGLVLVVCGVSGGVVQW